MQTIASNPATEDDVKGKLMLADVGREDYRRKAKQRQLQPAPRPRYNAPYHITFLQMSPLGCAAERGDCFNGTFQAQQRLLCGEAIPSWANLASLSLVTL